MKYRRRIFIVIAIGLFVSLGCSLLDLTPPAATETPPTEETVKMEPTPTSRPMATREPVEETLPPQEERTASLEVINDSGVPLTELYISPVESNEWGSNWLDMPLAAGQRRTLSGIPPAVYDLQAGNPELEVVETLYNVELTGTHTWTVVGTASVAEGAVLRFEEDFSDNRNNWGGIDDGDVIYNVPANGEYCIDIRVSDMTAWEWYEPFRTTEFFAEVKCTVDPMTDASCGLGYGADGDNLVWYEIDASTQSYALFFLKDDVWQDALVSWTEAQHIAPDGENYLGMGRLGDTLYLYVNGVLINTVQADIFAEGRIGIGGATYEDANVTICLDDLRVWQLESASGAAAPVASEPLAATEAPAETEAPAASSAPLEITWEGPMGYEGREGQSRWCEMKMTYHNVSGATIDWPAYQPLFLIRNGDGSEEGWYYANYYRKEDGWPNGIEGEPPPLTAGGSANWTWYSYTDRADQYCAAVAVEYGGWLYRATYGPQGALLNTEVVAP